MSSAWGNSWGDSWNGSWGTISPAGGGVALRGGFIVNMGKLMGRGAMVIPFLIGILWPLIPRS